MIDAELIWRRKLDNERERKLFARDEVSAQERDLAATAAGAEAIFRPRSSATTRPLGQRKEDINIARANLNQAGASSALAGESELLCFARSIGGRVTVARRNSAKSLRPLSGRDDCGPRPHLLRVYCRDRFGNIHWGRTRHHHRYYPGKQYHGRISFIDRPRSSRQERTDLQRGDARLPHQDRHRQSKSRIKPGMPADARIDLAANKQNAKRTSESEMTGQLQSRLSARD